MTDELARARAWNEANPDRVRVIRAKYRAAHPDRTREHYQKNRDRVIARVLADRAAHPWKRRAYRAQLRAVKHDALCTCCADEQRRAVYVTAPPGSRVVHVTPLASGGKHCQHNLRVISPGHPTDSNADLVT